jgi:hypothetical protein
MKTPYSDEHLLIAFIYGCLKDVIKRRDCNQEVVSTLEMIEMYYDYVKAHKPNVAPITVPNCPQEGKVWFQPKINEK